MYPEKMRLAQDNYYDIALDSPPVIKRAGLATHIRQVQQQPLHYLGSGPIHPLQHNASSIQNIYSNNGLNVSIHSLLSTMSVANSSSSSINLKGPRKVASATLLPTLVEKRPGDFYTQKLAKAPQISPAPVMAKRPISGESTTSAQSSCSDALSSPHFPQELRLSSLTSTSIVLPLDLPDHSFASVMDIYEDYEHLDEEEQHDKSKNHDSFNESSIDNSLDEDYLSNSMSTITLRPSFQPQFRLVSTPGTLHTSTSTPVLPHGQRMAPSRSMSTSHVRQGPALVRTKSSYVSPQESKERRQSRKKLYDDNDADDDVLLDTTVDNLFNVPMIKSSELYINTGGFQNDFMSTRARVPQPLSLQKDLPEDEHDMHIIPEDDSQITNNISNFYNQRSSSMTKMMKQTREQHVYKLPQYVRSQSLVDDLHLFSQEKMNAIDQTRPINLPPKTDSERAKHQKELQKVLTVHETATKSMLDLRKKVNKTHLQNHQAWIKVIESTMVEGETLKQFSKKLLYEKNQIRKLSWECNIPQSHRFDFLMRILASNPGSTVDQIRASYDELFAKYSALSHSVRANKDAEFNRIIDWTLSKPFFDGALQEATAVGCSVLKLHENYRTLLYVKSLSESGLHKHDELFLIPVMLVLFQGTQSLKEIYVMVELLNQQIFTTSLASSLTAQLSNWKSTKLAYLVSAYLYKYLLKFQDLSEFDNLNSSLVYDMFLQMNDHLPLSLSAPSTPVLSQNPFNFLGAPQNLPSVSSTSDLSMNLSPNLSRTSTDDAPVAEINSASLQLALKLIQMLVVFSFSSKQCEKNHRNLLQTFLLNIFQYYHINWNNVPDLLRNNKSIRVNHTADQVANLESFVDKWKESFKKF